MSVTERGWPGGSWFVCASFSPGRSRGMSLCGFHPFKLTLRTETVHAMRAGRGVFLLAEPGCVFGDWLRSARVHWEEIMGQGTVWFSRGRAVKYLTNDFGFIFLIGILAWLSGPRR